MSPSNCYLNNANYKKKEKLSKTKKNGKNAFQEVTQRRCC